MDKDKTLEDVPDIWEADQKNSTLNSEPESSTPSESPEPSESSEPAKPSESSEESATPPENLDFKSTEIYKTKSATPKDYFAKEDTKKKPLNPKKLILIIIVAVILLIAIIIGIIFLVITLNSKQATQEVTEESTPISKTVSNAEEIIESYDQRIQNASSKEEQSELYIDRANFLYSSANTIERTETISQQILADAYAAEAASPTAETAMAIVKYETIYGNKEAANQYYRIAIERDPSIAENNKKGSG